MQFKPSIWFPIAIILAGLNLIAVPVYSADPWHAFAHGAVGVAFALWAQRLKQRRDRDREGQRSIETPTGERLEGVEDELTRLRQELGETQERLDFTERMLAQRKQDPQREPRP